MPACLADGRVPFVRIVVLAALLAASALVAGAADASAATRTVRASVANDGIESQVVALLNGVRASQGLPALRSDDNLNEAADSHSRGMVTSGVFSHDSASGTPCDVRIRRFVKARLVGETIAWLAGTPGVAAGAAHGGPLDELAAAPSDAPDARLQADRRLPQGREDVRPSGRGLHGRPGRLTPRPLRPASSLPCRRSRPRWTAAMNFERLTSRVLRISSA